MHSFCSLNQSWLLLSFCKLNVITKYASFCVFLRLLQDVSGTFIPFTQSAPKRMQTEALESAASSITPWFPRAMTLPWHHQVAKVIAPGGQLKFQRSLRISEQTTAVVPISCTSLWTATSVGQRGRMSCLPMGWNIASWTQREKRRVWWLSWGHWWGCCSLSSLLPPSYWCWDPDRRMGRRDGGRGCRRWWKGLSAQSPCWWWGCKTATTAQRSEHRMRGSTDGQRDEDMGAFFCKILDFFF